MDIYCCGMYRSCSTWQYEITLEILRRAHERGEPVRVEPLGYRTGPQFAAEEAPKRSRERIRVMKAHEGHPSFSRALTRGRAVGIYAHRDVRDVVFSLMYKRQQSFREIVRTGMIHQILANDRFWRLHPQVLVQRYDDIMDQPASAIEEIAFYLNVELPAEEPERLANAYSKEANLRRTAETRNALAEKGIDLSTDAHAEVYDPQTLLHWNHIRPEADDWRALASDEERAVMRRLLGRWLSDNGYPADDPVESESQPSPGKTWRTDTLHGKFRCHSRELSSRYHRVALPLKRLLGIGAAERRSKSIDVT